MQRNRGRRWSISASIWKEHSPPEQIPASRDFFCRLCIEEDRVYRQIALQCQAWYQYSIPKVISQMLGLCQSPKALPHLLNCSSALFWECINRIRLQAMLVLRGKLRLLKKLMQPLEKRSEWSGPSAYKRTACRDVTYQALAEITGPCAIFARVMRAQRVLHSPFEGVPT